MAGYIGSKASVTQVDGYNRTEADSEFVNDPNEVITVSGSNVGIGTSSPATKLQIDANSNATTDYPLTINNSANNYGFQVGAYGLSNRTYGASSISYDFDIGGAAIFKTNNAERMRIDSSGRVTMPYQPSFKVAANYSVPTLIAGAALSYTVVEYDVGNNFANSRFTAPVAGVYHFDVSVFVSTVVSGSGFSYIVLLKNGSIIAPYSHSDTNNITSYDTLSLSRTVQLAANDYVQVYVFNDPNHRVYNSTSYNHFSGHLIG